MDWTSSLELPPFPSFPSSSFNFDFGLTGFAQTQNERCTHTTPHRTRPHRPRLPRSPRHKRPSPHSRSVVARYEFCPPVTLERSYSCPVKRTIQLSTSETARANSSSGDLTLDDIPRALLPVASEVNTPEEELLVTAFDLGMRMEAVQSEGTVDNVQNMKEGETERQENERKRNEEDREMREVRVEDIADEEAVGAFSEPQTSTTSSEIPKKRTAAKIGDDVLSSPSQPKKKYRKPNTAEENEVLVRLIDEEKKSWPEVMKEFEELGWGDRKMKLLKARYKAYKEGSVFWEGGDLDILTEAHWRTEREFEDKRWDEVAERMVTMGASRKFPPWACERKFKERVRRKEEEEERIAKEKAEKAEREKTEAEKAEREKIRNEGKDGQATSTGDDKVDDILKPEPKRRKRNAKIVKENEENAHLSKSMARKSRGKGKSKEKKTKAKITVGESD